MTNKQSRIPSKEPHNKGPYQTKMGSSRICVYPIASIRRLGRAGEGIWQNNLRQNNERKG